MDHMNDISLSDDEDFNLHDHSLFKLSVKHDENSSDKSFDKVKLTSQEYLAMHSQDDPLNCWQFVQMPAIEKQELLIAIDELEACEGGVQIGTERLEDLQRDILQGSLSHSIYTKDLNSLPVRLVHDKSDLPDLNEDSDSLKDWLHSPIYHAVAGAFPAAGQAAFEVHADIDATVVLMPTLQLLNAPIRFFLTPQEGCSSAKIKQKWRGESLSKKIHFEAGSVDAKFSFHLVLPQYEQHHPQRQSIIRALYKIIYAGIKQSEFQAGSSGLKKDSEALLDDKNAKSSRTTIYVDTFKHVQAQVENFKWQHRKVEVLYLFQYFGDKFQLANKEALVNHVNYLSGIFNLDAILDPTSDLGRSAVFSQDIAITIAALHNPANPITVAFAPHFLQSLGNRDDSHLKTLFRFNCQHDLDRAQVNNGSSKYFSNLGVGVLNSAMVAWKSPQVLVSGIKAYNAASEYWRNNAPYADKSFAVFALPMDSILSCASVTDADRALINKHKKLHEASMNKKDNEGSKIQHIFSTLHGSSYGARLEVTVQNGNKAHLLETYDLLMNMGNTIIETHSSLVDLHNEKQIPFETLRLSPIQVMDSRSLYSLASFQATMLHSMIAKLFLSLDNGAKDFNPDAVNMLSLLENVQQFLWSGSLTSINCPALINRIKLVDGLTKYNRIHLPQTLCLFNWEEPCRSLFHLPFGGTRSEEPFLAIQLALSHRSFYRGFGGSSQDFLHAFKSYCRVLQLFMAPRQSFFTPLYHSKTHIMAANLLNCFFTCLFDYMDVDHSEQLAVFAAFCCNAPQLPTSMQLLQHSLTAEALLQTIFPLDGDPPPHLLDSDFATLWLKALSVISSLNSTMKWSAFTELRDKSANIVRVKPVIRSIDIHNQMQILLHQSGVAHIPVVGTAAEDGLVLSNNNSYLVARLSSPYYSSVLPANNKLHGSPLPHPVDNSFIFMLAEKLAKSVGSTPQQQNEFIGHVVYHYTKISHINPAKPLPVPRYRTLIHESLAATGILECEGKRNPFVLLSPNELFWLNIDNFA